MDCNKYITRKNCIKNKCIWKKKVGKKGICTLRKRRFSKRKKKIKKLKKIISRRLISINSSNRRRNSIRNSIRNRTVENRNNAHYDIENNTRKNVLQEHKETIDHKKFSDSILYIKKVLLGENMINANLSDVDKLNKSDLSQLQTIYYDNSGYQLALVSKIIKRFEDYFSTHSTLEKVQPLFKDRPKFLFKIIKNLSKFFKNIKIAKGTLDVTNIDILPEDLNISETTDRVEAFLRARKRRNESYNNLLPSPKITIYDCYAKLFIALGYFTSIDIPKIYFNLKIFPYLVGYNLGLDSHILWTIYNKILNKKNYLSKKSTIHYFKYKRRCYDLFDSQNKLEFNYKFDIDISTPTLKRSNYFNKSDILKQDFDAENLNILFDLFGSDNNPKTPIFRINFPYLPRSMEENQNPQGSWLSHLAILFQYKKEYYVYDPQKHIRSFYNPYLQLMLKKQGRKITENIFETDACYHIDSYIKSKDWDDSHSTIDIILEEFKFISKKKVKKLKSQGEKIKKSKK